ncbi:Holliday junction resolvase RuvX [Anaerofustis sp.]|uniref:Holliday junction resolvase RuvX n=1 Tax=Anaerofustis sp. TaxID=1872517 RepID=UPI0025BE6DF1|nr:Holliday junction resolvase RuvX [Anaerofustis sp.]
MEKRILAIDYGDSRIGIAVSDALHITAQGVGVIKRTKNLDTDIEQIKKYIKDYDAGLVILGNPLNLNGEKGKRALVTEEFYEILKDKVEIPVKLWDERLSTKEAERALEAGGVNWRKKREVIDMMAAQIILSSYLDYNNNNIGGF